MHPFFRPERGGGRPYFFPLQKGLILFLPSSDREFRRKCPNNIPERLWRREKEEEEEKEQRLRHKEGGGGGMKRKGAKSPHSKISHILLFMPASPPLYVDDHLCLLPVLLHTRKGKGGISISLPNNVSFRSEEDVSSGPEGKMQFFSLIFYCDVGAPHFPSESHS